MLMLETAQEERMLTMELALERAIEAERQGAAFYRMIANMTDDPDAQAFLAEMAGEEEQHAATLRAMLEGGQQQAIDWSRILSMSESDDSPSGSGEETMDLREAVELALESEKHAAYTYACMGSETQGEVQELFTRLALTEQHHAELLEGLLEKLGGGDSEEHAP
jgi:rubrerythrin